MRNQYEMFRCCHLAFHLFAMIVRSREGHQEEESEMRSERLDWGDEVQTFISLCRHVSVDSAVTTVLLGGLCMSSHNKY